MRGETLLLLSVLGCLLSQTVADRLRMPSKEDLCGLVVDAQLEEECLQCFTQAGNISHNPEGVRSCVATYLPPLVANCAVPHPDQRRLLVPDVGRIQQKPPQHHHNHTNANLLPNCLTRRMRDISRYLRKEVKFAKQAGNMVKNVVTAKLIKEGGPTLLNIEAQKKIFAMPEVQRLVETYAAKCFDWKKVKPKRLRSGESSSKEDEDENLEKEDVDALMRHLPYEPQEDDEYLKKENHGTRRVRAHLGNDLPFGGTNCLVHRILVGNCFIDSLVKNGGAMDLIRIIQRSEFFYPVPQWWVEPLLRVYKLNNNN